MQKYHFALQVGEGSYHFKKSVLIIYMQVEYWAKIFYHRFQLALVIENPPASAGDIGDEGSIPGSGRSPGGGCGNPLPYSCLENPIDRGPGGLHSIASQRVAHD